MSTDPMSTELYYSLTVSAVGTSTSAYYSVTPTSNLQMSQGGVTIAPTAAATTLVNLYPTELQIQAPPGFLTGGVTIVTSADVIAGRIVVSPPVNVEVIVTLYGAGSTQLGQFILDPETGTGVFSFPTDPKEGMTAAEALKVMQQQTQR